MTLHPYKFVVQAVVQEHDEDGNVIGERNAEPVVVFGCAQLAEWANDFPASLAAAEASTAAPTNGADLAPNRAQRRAKRKA